MPIATLLSMDMISYFKQAHIPLSSNTLKTFQFFLTLFKDWNEKMNLSAIREDADIISKHFIDSLMPLRYFDFYNANSLIDIGTGGGFPGIPLKIYFPHLHVCLNDSIQKKLIAADDILQNLKLKNILTVSARAEELGHDISQREQYDIATIRAVSLLQTGLEYAAPFVKKNGSIIVYKGNTFSSEILLAKNAIKELGLILQSVHVYHLPEGEDERAILIFERTGALSKKYPRGVGIPKKDPL